MFQQQKIWVKGSLSTEFASCFDRFGVRILITSSNQRLWRRVRRFPAEVSPWKKEIKAAKRQSEHQKTSNFSAQAQGNQHEIRIAFFQRD